MIFIVAVCIGLTLPAQTGVNARLKERVGTPYGSALISFIVGTVFLTVSTLLLEHDFFVFSNETLSSPWWIWIGGCLGVIYMTGNILLMPLLGGVQTAIFPVAGQILMGLIIDHFALFHSVQIPLSLPRGLGAAIVLGGVLLVTLGKRKRQAAELSVKKPRYSGGSGVPSERNSGSTGKGILWLWRIAGIGTGMLSASQTAINGYLGRLLESAVKASFVSFTVGMITLIILNLLLRDTIALRGKSGSRDPWWIWIGGILGALFVLGNIYLTKILGVGMTLVAVLIGIILGGILIDQFGLLGAQKKPVTVVKILGLAVMTGGAAMVRLL